MARLATDAYEGEVAANTERLCCIVSNARPVDSRSLFALVDVEVQIAGVSFHIQGVQARRLPAGGTSVHVPTYKDSDGSWAPAIILPDQLRAPLADAVLTFLVEAGEAEVCSGSRTGANLQLHRQLRQT